MSAGLRAPALTARGVAATVPLLIVTSLTVFSDRVEALVHVDGPLRTTAYPGLAERALAWMPALATHACDNPAASSFADELSDTELPHLAEHIALDLIRRAGVRGRLRGDTSWDFERDGAETFRMMLDCPDDAVALGALKAAIGAVDALAHGAEPPDPQAEATRLRALRGRPEPRPRPRRGA